MNFCLEFAEIVEIVEIVEKILAAKPDCKKKQNIREKSKILGISNTLGIFF